MDIMVYIACLAKLHVNIHVKNLLNTDRGHTNKGLNFSYKHKQQTVKQSYKYRHQAVSQKTF